MARLTGRSVVLWKKSADISAVDLKKIIAGDVGGILIPKPGASAGEEREVSELNAMWTGITKEQLSRLALRAGSVHGAGVVVAAIGRERATIIAEMIRLEMINELIIDWDLANALEARFL